MADDFGLLFDAIAVERPSRLDAIIIAAKGVAAQRQEDAFLMLPYMGHFVDEQALAIQV